MRELGEGLSPYPFLLSLPQDVHEDFLNKKLTEAGGAVEWDTELSAFLETESGIRGTLTKNGVDEGFEVEYLCGCDGSHSTVRHGLRIGFPGGSYESVFFVADLTGEGPCVNGDLNMCLGATEFCAVIPVRHKGTLRLIGIVPDALKDRGDDLTFEDIQPFAERLINLKVSELNWFSLYHVHHRVAEHFRKGRAFLAGDAGHIHSPAGGQGMNTGIGDAVNLSWKLAYVLQGKGPAKLLDTYEPERIAFARTLIASTDKAFQVMVNRSAPAQFLRTWLLPKVAPLAMSVGAVRQLAFRTLSQTRIHYHDSALSSGQAGDVKGGDRLPWTGDNFDVLKSMNWQVHVYGMVRAEIRSLCSRLGLDVHSWPWAPECARVGLAEDALYLVRPDAHVALADESQSCERLEEYWKKWGSDSN
jgi:2-polyprenyl-6-methoxyphenol hydroxylase-like FAD-dependent oxidoreductase